MTKLDLQTVIQRFAQADCSWLSTLRPDFRPHSAPIWHVWTNGCAYVVTKDSAVKVENIRHHSSVVLTHPDPHKAIIIEGDARIVEGKTGMLRPLFKAKYDWDIGTDEDYTTIIEVRSQKVLAWGEEGAGYRQRWTGEEVMALG